MIQKTTKHSSFGLFNGRRVPDFKNFRIDKASADEAALIRRSAQTQEHQKIIVPEVVENIKLRKKCKKEHKTLELK